MHTVMTLVVVCFTVALLVVRFVLYICYLTLTLLTLVESVVLVNVDWWDRLLVSVCNRSLYRTELKVV